MSTPPYGSHGSARVGAADATTSAVLRAWLYEVDQNGTSRPMWATGGQPMKTVPLNCVLHVSVEGGQDSPEERFLRAPRAEGMASDPVTVYLDARSGYWMIRNSGRTNTLRVQQYGLSAVPLRPGTAMPMSGEDVAVWIPVVPRGPRAIGRSEAFRLLILNAREPSRRESSREPALATQPVVGPVLYLSPAKQEALIAYFGDFLSWPPLPAPHVRQQQEVEDIAFVKGLARSPNPKNWARNRHDVLAGQDGLFTAAEWYPRLGGPGRSLANHLAAFHRLVEVRSITLPRVRRWATEHDVEPYVIIDRQLGSATRA
jgi:hypothetical protein